MLFTDPLFLFYFLPLALILVRLASPDGRLRDLTRFVIIFSTLVFYAYENWRWPLIFLAIVGWTYGCAFLINRTGSTPWRKLSLSAGISGGLALLFFFKYLNWLASIFAGLVPVQTWLAGPFGDGHQVILPPGISFYVFEAVSFAIDEYRRKVCFPKDPLDYVTFLAMFPRFIAGPIVRYSDVETQFKTWSGVKQAQGLTLFGIGFFIKVCFADQFSVFVPYAFGVAHPDALQAWSGVLSYTFQLYFDFWGYSLMATGLGMCLGFSFPDNFRSPYHAHSIADFWHRWHITLSSWLRDYLYISLGGNRVGKLRTYINLLVTMTLGGLWHGANYTFVIWGFYHGVLLVAERLCGKTVIEKLPRAIRIGSTFLMVVFGWVLFRASNLSQAGDVFAGMLGINGLAQAFNPLLGSKHLFSVFLSFAGIAFSVWGERWLVRPDRAVTAIAFSGLSSVLVWLMFLVALAVSMSSESIPFLYFQF